MKIFLSLKYHADLHNRPFAERICQLLEGLGHSCYLAARDIEAWGEKKLDEHTLMRRTFEIIDHCDLVLIDLSEKGVGIGIEAGYAFARGVWVLVAAPAGKEISATLRGIAHQCFYYDAVEEIALYISGLQV